MLARRYCVKAHRGVKAVKDPQADGDGMPVARVPNARLAAVIAESGLSHAQLAAAVARVASENGAGEFAAIGRSHVSHWVGGTNPSGSAPLLVCEALGRRLGRVVTVEEVGFKLQVGASRDELGWHVDTLIALTDLGRIDTDMERRHVLGAAAYSVAALSLPGAAWWQQMSQRSTARGANGSRLVGRGDLDAVRDMVAMFSRVDQRRGGGHARTAVVQYLTSDVAGYLCGKFSSDQLRRDMFSAASELSCLSGWMAFDNAEHSIAQNYFTLAVKLAAEADDAPMTGHVLRAMAHQANDLGHRRQALSLASTSIEGDLYRLASSRERALLGVVHARTLASNGQSAEAAAALLRAENDLAAASLGDDEPPRVFFFGEASLAHETACAIRDTGDFSGAAQEFRRSVRTRKASAFTRTHAVTLGYLGSVQARQGNVEEACTTWSAALDSMDGIRSARTRQTAVDMRSSLSPFRQRGLRSVAELDARAAAYLALST